MRMIWGLAALAVVLVVGSDAVAREFGWTRVDGQRPSSSPKLLKEYERMKSYCGYRATVEAERRVGPKPPIVIWQDYSQPRESYFSQMQRRDNAFQVEADLVFGLCMRANGYKLIPLPATQKATKKKAKKKSRD